ncbi:MAG TPA: hypothetical protein DDY78_23210 [Planctomycetales bacterium]|jgi:hypothetical protein|nr:hypothetical protein [Planctomycetales bacterium]
MVISEQAILDALHQVSAERWDEVLSFLQALKNEARPIRTGADMAKSELVGLWADRDDIGDSREFARRLRREAETRQGPTDAAGH